MGYFVEIKVPLFVPSYIEKYRRIPASDVDVLGVRFDPAFAREVAVAECKSGEHEALEEVLKLQGIRDFLQAKAAYLVKERVHPNAREVGRKLGIDCFESGHLVEFATRLGLQVEQEVEREGQYIEARHTIEGKADKAATLLSYAASEFWSREYWENISNIIYLARPAIAGREPPLPKELEFLILRTASLVCIATLTMCGTILNSGVEDVRRAVEIFLFGGPQARRQQERLLDELRKAAPRSGALPRDVNPPFTSDLAELVAYLLLSPREASMTPTVFASLLRAVAVDDLASIRRAGYNEVALKLTKDVCHFVLASVGVAKPTVYLPDIFAL
jgi:hypothetical protein